MTPQAAHTQQVAVPNDFQARVTSEGAAEQVVPTSKCKTATPRISADPVRVPVANNGQTLEGIMDEDRIPGSLFPPEMLSFAKPPKAASSCYKKCRCLTDLFGEWRDKIEACDQVELESILTRLVYALHQQHQQPFRNFAQRKSLPLHVAGDRRDPVALIITAVQLLHDGLPCRREGRVALDFDRFVYVLDRLREAALVQVARYDARFDALKAFADFVAAVVARYDADCPFCVETL